VISRRVEEEAFDLGPDDEGPGEWWG